MERNVEQLYWDNVNLQSRVNRLEAQILDLERRLDSAFNELKMAIGQNTTATLEAIDEMSRDWRQNR